MVWSLNPRVIFLGTSASSARPSCAYELFPHEYTSPPRREGEDVVDAGNLHKPLALEPADQLEAVPVVGKQPGRRVPTRPQLSLRVDDKGCLVGERDVQGPELAEARGKRWRIHGAPALVAELKVGVLAPPVHLHLVMRCAKRWGKPGQVGQQHGGDLMLGKQRRGRSSWVGQAVEV